MKIPEKYKGDLQYHKIEGFYDIEIEMLYIIEDLLVSGIKERGPQNLSLVVETWEGLKRHKIDAIPEREIDQAVEWLHEIDAIRILEAKITSSGKDLEDTERENDEEDVYFDN